MLQPMVNAMRLQAERAASAQAGTRVGLVTSYDPNTFYVRVQLQPEGTITGWLPLCSPWIGNGWGMFAAPSVGDQVAVHFFGADLDAGFVEGRMFNGVDLPLPAPSGEFWLVHKSGSFLKFTNDGNVTVHSAGDLAATVGGNLNALVSGNATANISGSLQVTANGATVTANTTVNGNVIINGNLSVSGTASATGALSSAASVTAPTVTGTTDVMYAGKSAAAHKHTGVSTGTGQTGPTA